MSNNTKNKRLGRGLSSLLGGYSEEESILDTNKRTKPKETKSPVSVQSKTENAKQKKNFHAESAKKEQEVVSSQVSDKSRIWKLAIDKIEPNPYQPRQEFIEEKLRELADSIKEQGILQPIVVRKTADNRYQIVSGERRWRASQMAGLHDVPVIIRNIDDKRSLELAIIENVQRADLNPVEEAEAYYQLQQDFGLTQDQIAKRIGKERATVANLLRLLQLDPEVRKLILKEHISQGHAKVLLSVKDEILQKKLAKKAAAKKWSVRQLEKEIKKAANKDEQSKKDSKLDVSKQLAQAIGEDIQKRMGTKVKVDYSAGKGKIELYFYSDEQLTAISDKIKEAWM